MKIILYLLSCFAVSAIFCQQQILLSTDQSFYFTGEEAKVSVFVENAIGHSMVLTLTLEDGESDFKLEKQLSVSNGIGSILFSLGQEIKSGEYSLHLHNGDILIGIATIQIINRAVSSPVYFVGEKAISEQILLPDTFLILSILKDEQLIQEKQITVEEGIGSSSQMMDSVLGQGYDVKVQLRKRYKIEELKPKQESGSILSQPSKILIQGLEKSFFTSEKNKMVLSLVDQDIEWANVEVSISNRLNDLSIVRLPGSIKDGGFRDGSVLTGLLKSSDGQLLQDHAFVVIAPSTQVYYNSRTNVNGEFKIQINPYEEDFHCIFLSIFDQYKDVKVELDEVDLSKIDYATDVENRSELSASRDLQNLVINEAFTPGTLNSQRSGMTKWKRYTDLYDFNIRPGEYVGLKTISEILHEIVPKVHVTNGKFRIVPVESTIKYQRPPLFFINGIPTFDYDFILELDPSEVESIGVIASKQKLKSFYHAGSGGIVEFNMTKDFDMSEVPTSSNILKITGNPVASVSSISFSDSPISFASSLYWNPELQLKNGESISLEFKTSFESGTYQIRIAGVTSGGEFISTIEEFEIIQRGSE